VGDRKYKDPPHTAHGYSKRHLSELLEPFIITGIKCHLNENPKTEKKVSLTFLQRDINFKVREREIKYRPEMWVLIVHEKVENKSK
jgi:hypothetical protein